VLRLPYAPRPAQAELVAEADAAVRDATHLVVEAGTGTGKTVSILTATLGRTDGVRVIYATRTNAQQTQVIREHSALVDSGQDPGLLVPFMGRRHYCPFLRDDARFADGTAEELGRLCRDAKRKARDAHETGRAVEGACPYYARLLRDGAEPVEALLRAGGLDAGELARRIENAGSCAYEALKLLMPRAAAVAVPYAFVVEDRLRLALFEWMGAPPGECILVVDEAHNLPDAARDAHSPRLSAAALKKAQSEAEEFGDPTLAGATLASSLVQALLATLARLRRQFIPDSGAEDGLLPPDAFTETLLQELRLPTPALERLANDLDRWGDIIRDARRTKGRLPRSHLGALGTFLHAWLQSRDVPYVDLVTGGENPALELYLLDPAPLLSWLAEFRSTIHMSGTLAPLAEHAALCGLPATGTRLRTFASPFAPENLRILGMEGIERRFDAIQRDPSLAGRQQELARAVLGHCPGRTGLFFPSHKMLQDYLEEGFLHGIGRSLFVEHARMKSTDLAAMLADFKSEPSGAALILGVLGGRLSEGMDFPGKAMEHLLVFGVPYPTPSARLTALVRHFDRVAGNGWSVAVHTPTGRALRQAVGRLVRGPEDRGTAVILDDRVVRFHAHLPRLRMIREPREADPAAPEPASGYRPALALWAESKERDRKAPPVLS
jgi:DNA excision repair protein ERCC-2